MRLDILHEIERYKIMDIKPNYSEIARRLECDRRTVADYFNGKTLTVRKSSETKSILDDYKAIIEDKVDSCSASAMAIFKFIEKKGYPGKYGLVKRYVRQYKDIQTKKATIRFETMPGYQGQVDWKEQKKMISKYGEIFEINIFLYLLGYSRIKYLELTFDRQQTTLFKCLCNGFSYAGGIPKQVLFDNMKTVVDQSRTHASSVVLNQRFRHFAKDMGFEAMACMPYRPQTKGKVESLAKLTSRLDVYNYEFEDEKDLKRIVNMLNTDLNLEVSQATGERPIDRFDKEKEYLRSLPSDQIIETYTSLQKIYSVSKESMITYKGNKYSVPTYYIDKKVKVKDKNDFLEIYFDSELIAEHKTSERFLNYKKHHVIEILKTDAFRYKDDTEIDDFVENNLKNFDMLIT